MSYLDKCTVKTDLLFNKLKPSRNIIVFIVSENVYTAYTLNDLKEIINLDKRHYIDGCDILETFFYLPNGIVVDSSLKTCFENKVNTMKLVETGNKFQIRYGNSRRIFVYYKVEAVSRQSINSTEESTFDPELVSVLDSGSDVEIDTVELKKQRKDRKIRQRKQKTSQERKSGNYTETKNYENGVKHKVKYSENIKIREIWSKNRLLHRDDGLPAVIDYRSGNNEYKYREQWYVNGEKYRDNDQPTYVEYHENGNKSCECWFTSQGAYRDNDLPAIIEYRENGNKFREEWWINAERHRNNNPAVIHYYENGNKHTEEWWTENIMHRDNDLPACTGYYKNGNKYIEEWWFENDPHRDNDLPAYIEYDENNNKKYEKWFVEGDSVRSARY